MAENRIVSNVRTQRQEGLCRRASRAWSAAALVRRLAQEDVELLDGLRAARIDLRDQAAVSEKWMAANRPHAVFLAAAKVGGIVANNTLRAEFLYDNLMIEANVIQAAHVNGASQEADVPRLVLHLSQAGAAAAARRLAADRSHWSRPTNGMRSPRSPASSWWRPIEASSDPTSSM